MSGSLHLTSKQVYKAAASRFQQAPSPIATCYILKAELKEGWSWHGNAFEAAWLKLLLFIFQTGIDLSTPSYRGKRGLSQPS